MWRDHEFFDAPVHVQVHMVTMNKLKTIMMVATRQACTSNCGLYGIYTKLLILIILKESSIERQDGLYTSEHNRLSGVSNLLESLKWPWPALELHHKIARLSSSQNYVQLMIKSCRSFFIF